MRGAGLHVVCLLKQAQGLYAACRNTYDRAATLIELREQEAPLPNHKRSERLQSVAGGKALASVNGQITCYALGVPGGQAVSECDLPDWYSQIAWQVWRKPSDHTPMLPASLTRNNISPLRRAFFRHQ